MDQRIKKWNILVVGGLAGVLTLFMAFIYLVDPYMHYRPGLGDLQYPLQDERYAGDGIARHYDYEALIAGSSMCQNFKPSLFEELLHVSAIKNTYSGASFRESKEAVERAISYNGNLKYVLRSIDASLVNRPADYYSYEGLPDYLYDQNPFNDVKYLLNKEMFLDSIAVLNYSKAGNQTLTRDEFTSWSKYKVYGEAEVLKTVQQIESMDAEYALSDSDIQQIKSNIEQNFVKLAKDNPDITFFCFFPPYSILHWNVLKNTRQLSAQLLADQITIEALLEAPNIQIYSFSEEKEMISNLNNYTDALHYGDWINDRILEWISRGEHRITEDNYIQYLDNIRYLYG